MGIGTLADAALRVVMAYTLPPDVVPALDTTLQAATTVVLFVVANVYYVTSGVYNPGRRSTGRRRARRRLPRLARDAPKRDLVDYLDAVADRIIRELAGRPLSVVRVLRGQQPGICQDCA